MPTVHLIHGYLGAGKTTYAARLAQEQRAAYLSIDEWYLRLYTDGSPTSVQDPTLLDRLWRVLDDHWVRLVALGVDVVLDFGFWRKARRDAARDLAASVQAEALLHWVVADDAVALDRCLRRSEEPGANFVLDATTYRALRRHYEQPTADEQPHVVQG